jgi:uroporphyrinogen-III synthase
MNILNTRPKHQAAKLTGLLQEQGHHVVEFPCIAIIHTKGSPSLQKIAASQHLCDLCIVMSANAVPALPPIKRTNVIAIGPGTAMALERIGIIARVPDTFSTEGLLAMPALSERSIANKNIVIFSGEDPKPQLAKTLTCRRAVVQHAFCYKRVCPDIKPHSCPDLHDIDLIISTSPEALHNLCQLIGADQHHRLKNTALLVVSQKMRARAIDLGFSKVRLAKSASDHDIANSLLDADAN